jgi:hypothetical protein
MSFQNDVVSKVSIELEFEQLLTLNVNDNRPGAYFRVDSKIIRFNASCAVNVIFTFLL